MIKSNWTTHLVPALAVTLAGCAREPADLSDSAAGAAVAAASPADAGGDATTVPRPPTEVDAAAAPPDLSVALPDYGALDAAPPDAGPVLSRHLEFLSMDVLSSWGDEYHRHPGDFLDVSFRGPNTLVILDEVGEIDLPLMEHEVAALEAVLESPAFAEVDDRVSPCNEPPDPRVRVTLEFQWYGEPLVVDENAGGCLSEGNDVLNQIWRQMSGFWHSDLVCPRLPSDDPWGNRSDARSACYLCGLDCGRQPLLDGAGVPDAAVPGAGVTDAGVRDAGAPDGSQGAADR